MQQKVVFFNWIIKMSKILFGNKQKMALEKRNSLFILAQKYKGFYNMQLNGVGSELKKKWTILLVSHCELTHIDDVVHGEQMGQWE